MTDEVLDHFKDEDNFISKETPDFRKLLSLAWISFAISLLNRSFNLFAGKFLFTGQIRGILDLINSYSPSLEIAYHYFILGIVSFVMAIVILKNKPNRKEYLLIFWGIIVVFHLFESCFILSYEFFLRKEGLFCYVVTLASFYKHKEKLFPLNLLKVKIKYLPLLLIGILPFFMEKIIDYRTFHFWDLSWISACFTH
jgi:hypothetical protein